MLSLNQTGTWLFYRIVARERSGLKNAFFTGCIKNLVIDGHSINFDANNGDTLEQKGLETCDACTGNPCGKHGKCIADTDNDFTCECDENYAGKYCTAKGKHGYYL